MPIGRIIPIKLKKWLAIPFILLFLEFDICFHKIRKHGDDVTKYFNNEKKIIMIKKTNYLWLITLLIISKTIKGYSQFNNSGGWTQFRGPDRSGISTEKLKEIDWTEAQPELLWRKNIGSGFSELIISEGMIYTMISEQIDSISGSEYIAAFEESTGNEIWKSKVDSIFIDVDGWGNGPRSTPTIDENYIYSFSSFGKLTANSKNDGKLIWQVDFIKEFESSPVRWGFSTSPVLADGLLIIEAGGTESRAFIAFNKEDGKVVWAAGDGTGSYNSPLLATIDGQKQIIFANGKTLYSYNSDGDTLWTYPMPFRSITAMPVLIESNKLFISGVRNPGFFIVKVEKNKATEVINGNSMKNDFNSSCYHDGNLYGFHVAALRCLSADSGEVKWTKRGMGKGSLIIVDDKLIVLSDQGKLVIVEATPDAYEEKAIIQAINGKSWTAPSFANGKIYVRNLTEMACYKLY